MNHKILFALILLAVLHLGAMGVVVWQLDKLMTKAELIRDHLWDVRWAVCDETGRNSFDCT